MTFFENQAHTRRATSLLVVLFVFGVAGVILAIDAVVAVVDLVVTGAITQPRPSVPWNVVAWSSGITAAVIGLRSLFGIYRIRAGGDAIASLCGKTPLDRGTRDPYEARLLNIVDEMAIASGVAVPQVYVMRGEYGINAFAAGYGTNEAAIAVTAGALKNLNRDELQGVIAHEFSHILNGDARLNVDLVGVLDGLLFIGGIGTFIMRAASDRETLEARDPAKHVANNLMFLAAGSVITIIGYIGLFFGRLIKAAVARQREFLADASSVQFTRNPDGIAGALALVNASYGSSLIFNRHAEAMSHMFFVNGVAALTLEFVFPMHPPVGERIKRIDPAFDAERYLATRALPTIDAATASFTGPPITPAARVVPPRVAAAAVATPPAAAGAVPSRPIVVTPGPPVVGPATVTAVMASIGNPVREHVDYAATVLSSVPAPLREAISTAEGAQAVILAFALSDNAATRADQLTVLRRSGGDAVAQQADAMTTHERALPRAARLAVVALALPALRRLDQSARASFTTTLARVIDADRRVTLEEFVLLTIVRQQLRDDAGRATPVKYRSLMEIPEHASLVLSLLAHAGTGEDGDARPAFEKGAAAIRLTGRLTLIPVKAIAFAGVTAALDQLRLLAPFVKRELVRACVETVEADQVIRLAEAELLRAVAAAVDCPVPPVLDAVVPG